jgi:membrane associated rhomboid family serine protease
MFDKIPTASIYSNAWRNAARWVLEETFLTGGPMITTTPEPGLKSLGADAKAPITAVGSLVGVMWVSELLDTAVGHRLDRYGVQPRTLVGLRGIPFAPFLHVGWQHLIGNTVPFAILGVLIALSGVVRFAKANVIIGLCSGLGMWLFGATGSVHLGASGMVFGYLGHLLSRGFFDRRFGQIVLGAIVGVVYGGLLWGVLPTNTGVSWQGHLFGFLGGVVAAWIMRRSPKTPGKAASL